MKFELFDFDFDEIIREGYSLANSKERLDFFLFCIKGLKQAIIDNHITQEERANEMMYAIESDQDEIEGDCLTLDEIRKSPPAQLRFKENKIKSYQLTVKKLEEEILYIKKRGKIIDNSELPIKDPEISYFKGNLLGEVNQMVDHFVKIGKLKMQDPHFVKEAKKIIIPAINKKYHILLSLKNRNSVRIYLSTIRCKNLKQKPSKRNQ